ncbi:RpiR family transcriptional regulator [Mobilisporobacter senegalensis]|uniref:RpiR family transcriptional regulator n=1 Tax=Mobilisporobacter senegalensis TaxID=1329262 RepID=A0A3N1XNM3_9FIRM|nr:MurR/RpiR family transcriptional regulator [Mobilisporobacter senegalensis]ROR28279.1 RpiR family transcriptional regulator [Mobilisporobacter senegalensis]
MVSTVISKIVSLQHSFTLSENEISQYVINHPDLVVSSTITTIAKETGTSEASINRFCKKIGYKGFNGFKIALAQENFYNNMMKQNSYSAENGLISSVTADYRQMLMNTSAMLDESLVMEAIKFMKEAKNVHIFSLSNIALIAKELEFKLDQIGIGSKSFTDIIDMRIQATNIVPGDLSIFIAPTIMMRDIYQVANASLERGAKNLTITSYDSPKLNDISDFKFIISDKIVANNSVSLSNNLMFLYIIDILYSALLGSDKSLRQKKLNSDAIINNHQMMDSYGFDY